MSILKAIGLAIAKGISVFARFEGLLPAISALYPAAAPSLNVIDRVFGVVVSVEANAAALAQNGLSISGEQKMLQVVPQVAQLLSDGFAKAGHPVDPTKLLSVAQGLAQAVVDVANGIKVDVPAEPVVAPV